MSWIHTHSYQRLPSYPRESTDVISLHHVPYILVTFRRINRLFGEQESWGRLDEHLTSGAASRRLQTVNLVIVVTIDGDGLDAEDPEDRFEDLETHLMNEVRSSFPRSVEKDRITIEIDVRRHPRAQGSIV